MLRLLFGEVAMVASVAGRLCLPYESCGGVEKQVGRPDKETSWRRRWEEKEQGSHSLAADNCRSQRRGGDYLCCKFVLVRVSSYLGRGARLGEEPASLALLQTILLLPRNLPGPGPSLGGRQMSGLCKLYFSPNTKETLLPRLATEN